MTEKTKPQITLKPRGKGKILVDKGIYDAYLYYCKQTKELPDRYKMDRAKYGKIIKQIHKELARKMLYEAATFKMPAGLPSIRIKKYKRKIKFREDGSVDPKSLAINWQKTRELWIEKPETKHVKFVYFVNDHTDGYSARFILEKYSSRIKNLGPYRFKSSRDNDRELAKILLDPYNKIDYYE